MLKELMEVLVCVASFISGDYLDEEPNEWYRRCNLVIEDDSVCHEEMTENDFRLQWQAQEEMWEEREEQYKQQLQELKQELNANDVQTVIDYIDFNTEIPDMESLATLLNGTYSYESTLYGADGNRNEQYVEVNDLHIGLSKGKNGDVSVAILKGMKGVYSKIWKYEKIKKEER